MGHNHIQCLQRSLSERSRRHFQESCHGFDEILEDTITEPEIWIRRGHRAKGFDSEDACCFVLQSLQQQRGQAVSLFLRKVLLTGITLSTSQLGEQARGGHEGAFLDFLVDIVRCQERFDAFIELVGHSKRFLLVGRILRNNKKSRYSRQRPEAFGNDFVPLFLHRGTQLRQQSRCEGLSHTGRIVVARFEHHNHQAQGIQSKRLAGIVAAVAFVTLVILSQQRLDVLKDR
mmetsp:Transcript_18453/g.45720  ORF Transcript_18453/g.45720 Transcript_18453/m.45720 type:complete len:231 (+) Transcript_18453:1848-2540(+)